MYIEEAKTAWRLLNGIFTVYKPSSISMSKFVADVKKKICLGLNEMNYSNEKPPQLVQFLHIENNSLDNNSEESHFSSSNLPEGIKMVKEVADGRDKIQIVIKPNLAQHDSAIGPRYIEEDLRLPFSNVLKFNTSGLVVFGIGQEGRKNLFKIEQLKWIKTYLISGRFGIATSSGFHTGKIIDKSNYHKIKKVFFDTYLARTQSLHLKNSYLTTGLRMNSQKLYEIASQGPPRPQEDSTAAIVYGLRPKSFNLPNFEIELDVINEDEEFLVSIVNDMGIKLHSTATCTKIKCTKYGIFSLENSLLIKHVGPESLINSIEENKKLLSGINLNVRDPIIANENENSGTKTSNRVY